MDFIHRNYVWLFHDLSDPRLRDWPLMNSPFTLIGIIILYLFLVKVALPHYMKGRKAYSLKNVIKWYNIFQIVTNSVIFYGILTSGWLTHLTLGCHIPDYNAKDPESLRMLRWLYLALTFRITDILETMFFVLRKKPAQASYLHIYHHCISLTLLWLGVKYMGGGMASLSVLINTPIHSIMYAYYLISSEASPKLKVKMNKWKKWLTVLQMVQFTTLFIHSLQAFLPSCPVPQVLVWLYTPNVLYIYYMFYKFFRKTYIKKQSSTKERLNNNITAYTNGVVQRKTA